MRYPALLLAVTLLMKDTFMKFLILALLAFLSFGATAAQAQTASEASVTYAKRIAPVCIGAWETPACLTAVSESNLVMASNYGGALKERNLEAAAETLKQHCAASTAHREKQFPAYAMESAFVECINIISDLNDQTGLSPDVDHYQLLVMAGLCMRKDPRCAPMENALKQYR